MRLIVGMALALLAGCEKPDANEHIATERAQVEISVAQQALGNGTVSINPFVRNRLEAPGIYKIELDGNGNEIYSQVCGSSIRQLRQVAEVDTDTSDRVLSDLLSGTIITVATPFVNLSPRYDLQVVNGYSTTEFSGVPDSLSEGDIADELLDNVSDRCKDDILANLDYYMVVTGVAKSRSIRAVQNGGIEIEPFSIGLAGVTIENAGREREISQERVFAISGKLFREGNVTVHGL